MDRRVPFLAHKLPGTQGCHPGFDAFFDAWGASYHSQNGQYDGSVPHKPSGGFTVAPSSPLVPVHVPGMLNLAAHFLSGQKLRPGEWMLNRKTVSQIWNLFGKAEVDLFASQESSQCPLWFSLSFPKSLGIDALAHPWPNVSLYTFPTAKLIPAVLCRVQVSGARLLLIAPFWPSQTWFSDSDSPPVSAPLGDSDQAGPAVPASGQDLASPTRALEAVGMAHTGPGALMLNLPVEVQETIASARAPATRKLYSSKWGLFESWCLARAIDPVNCPVGPVLEFLQERLTTGAAATILRVCRGHCSLERAG